MSILSDIGGLALIIQKTTRFPLQQDSQWKHIKHFRLSISIHT